MTDPYLPPKPARSGPRWQSVRRHFLTGILVLTPAAVSAWVLYRLLAFLDGLLWEYLRFGSLRPGGIPGVGLITVVLLILFVGVLVNNYVGRRFYQSWDSLLVRIPLFNKIYVAVKQIGEALLSSDNSVFQAVGLIEYPRKGIYCLVFVTEAPGEEVHAKSGRKRMRSVFLPTTPNPTSGFLLMLPEDDIQRLDMTVEDGLKMVISGGAFVPGAPPRGVGPAPARRPGGWWWRPSRTPPPGSETGPEVAAPEAAGPEPEPKPGSERGDG